MDGKTESRIVDLCILSSLITLGYNTYWIHEHPVGGFLDSLISYIGWRGWALFASVFFLCSFGLIALNSSRKGRMAMLGTVLLLNNAAVLLAPYISGVFLMNGGDLPTHGGMTLDILRGGKVDFELNFYPFMHVLAAALSLSSGSDPMIVVRNLAPAFSLLVPVLLFLAARAVCACTHVQRLAFCLGSGFYLSSLFQPNSITTPNGLALMFLPILAYAIAKDKNRWPDKIIIVACLTPFVFFHPIVSFVVLGGLVGLALGGKGKSNRWKGSMLLYYACGSTAYMICLTVVWKRIATNIRDFLLGYHIPPGYAVDIRENLGKLGLDTIDLASLAVRVFGHQAVLMSCSSIFLIVVLVLRKNQETLFRGSPALRFMLSVFSIGVGLLALQLLVPTILNWSFFRSLVVALVFTPLFCAFLLGRNGPTRTRQFIVTILVTALFVASMLVLYPSPYMHQVNSQVTYEDLEGARWLLENKDAQTGLTGYLGKGVTVRIVSSLIPYSMYQQQRDAWLSQSRLTIPDHLGYGTNETLRETLQCEEYVVITKLDLVAYEGVYAHLGRITDKDLELLNRDSTASVIYQNGECLVVYVS